MLDRLLKGTVDGIVINRETVQVYTSQYEELIGLTFDEGEGFELDFSGICVGVRKATRNCWKMSMQHWMRSARQTERHSLTLLSSAEASNQL